MSNVFVNIRRSLSILCHRSKTSHCMCPISKCPRVTVFMDATEGSAQKCADAVNAFFAGYKVNLKIFALNAQKKSTLPAISGATMLLRRDLRWFGRPKRTRRHPSVDGKEDLFINLCPQSNFTAHYCALCSKAHFKVGRYSTKNGLYDIEVSNTDNYLQSQIFAQISSIIASIV